MKIKVIVFYTASNVVEVEVPDGLSIEYQKKVIQKKFDEDLPEVHQGSSFEFPVSFQIVADPENEVVDLKG